MRSLCLVTVVTIVTLIKTAWPCPSPASIEGVAFTSGEEIHLTLLASLGEEGTNYIVEGHDSITAISYRSHYDGRAVAYIGTYGLSYQEGTKLPCMGIILDPNLITDYQQIEESEFNFSEAVKTELQWLQTNGIIELSDEQMFIIDSSLQSAQNGGVQYWTMQKRVLGYNSWYDYDEEVGVWGVDGNGVSGVNEVREVNDIGCSVINPTFALNLAPIEGRSSVFSPGKVTRLADINTRAFVDKTGNISLRLSHPFSASTRARLMALNGNVISHFIIPAQTHEVSIGNVNSLSGAGFFILQWGAFNQLLPLSTQMH